MHTAYPDVLEYLRLWQLHWYVAGVCCPASVSPMFDCLRKLGAVRADEDDARRLALRRALCQLQELGIHAATSRRITSRRSIESRCGGQRGNETVNGVDHTKVISHATALVCFGVQRTSSSWISLDRGSGHAGPVQRHSRSGQHERDATLFAITR